MGALLLICALLVGLLSVLLLDEGNLARPGRRLVCERLLVLGIYVVFRNL